MKTKAYFSYVTVLVFAVGLLSGCSKPPTAPPLISSGGAISTGPSTDVTTQSLSSSGGDIVVDTGTLGGFLLHVPNSAFTDSRTYSISYAPVTGHTFGANFDPITPLILIRNGGGYADALCTIRIPCKVAAGKFAMGFAYSTVTNEIEALPLMESGSDHITVAIGSFDLFTRVSAARQKPGEVIQGSDDGIGVLVSQVDESTLALGSSSNFLPGVDDWDFINYGSVYNTDGQCDGQAVGAIWYYNEKHVKQGAPSLHGIYDNDGSSRKTPKLWMDDVKGYKFCNMLQKDNFWSTSTFSNLLGQFAQSIPFTQDRLTYDCFTYALLITHAPQFVGIYSSFFGDGHAMVVYETTPSQVMFADVNYPGDLTRHANYDGASLGVYYSGPNADYLGVGYTHFFFLGSKSLLRWHSIDSRWTELENGTIGNGSFPDFTLKALDTNDNFVPLADGFVCNGTLTLSPNAPGVNLKIAQVFNQGQVDLKNTSSIPLAKGKQYVGIYVTDMGGHWAGFKWYLIDNLSGSTDAKIVMPLATGNQWVYTEETFDSSGVRTSTLSQTLSIATSFQNAGETWYQSLYGGGRYYAYTNRHDGLYVGSAILVPTLFAKYPCFLNDTFSSTLNPNNGTIGNLIVTSALTEMTLPNGVLDTAFVVGQEFRDASGTLLSQQQINAFFLKGDFAGVQDLNYWVPGVGLVKEEIFDCSKNGVKFMSMRRTLQSWKLN